MPDTATTTTFNDYLSYSHFDAPSELIFLQGPSETAIGFGLSITPLLCAGADIEPNIEALFVNLPPDSVVTIGKLSCPQIEGFVSKWADHRLQKNRFPLLSKITEMRRDHYIQCATERSLLPHSKFHPRMAFYYIFVKIPFTGDSTSITDLQQAITSAKELRGTAKGALKAALLPSDNLSESELKYLLRELLNPVGQPQHRLINRSPTAPLLDDILDKATRLHKDNSGSILVSNDLLGDNACAITCLTIDAWPKHHYLNAMARTLGDPVSQDERITCPYWAYTIVHVLHPDKAKDDLFTKFGLLNKQTSTESAWYRSMMGPLFQRKERAEALLQELDNGHTLCRIIGGINLYTPPNESRQHAEYVKGLYRRIGCRLTSEPHISVPIFISSLPLQYLPSTDKPGKGLQRAELVSSLNAACTLQVQGDWRGTSLAKGGGLLLLSRSGQVISFDVFQSSTNYNFVVAAASGSGKSFFANELANDMLSRGGVVRIIDVGRSYARLCHIMKGQNIIFSPENPMSLNPFTDVTDQARLNELMPLLKALLRLMAYPLTPEEETPPFQYQLFEKAIQSAWNQHKENTELRHITEWLRNFTDDETHRSSDLAIQLEPFAEGRYSAWFSGRRTVEFTNPLVILELEELNQDTDLQAVIMQLIMFQTTKEMYLAPRTTPKLLLIDEAWAIMGGMKTGKFIETAFRRMRKYNGSAGVITQSFQDFGLSPASRAALENACWQISLYQKPDSLTSALNNKIITLPPYTEELVRSVRPGQGFSELFIRSEFGEGLYRFVTDPFTYFTYTTDPKDTNRIDALVASGQSLIQAIETLAIESHRKQS